MLVGSQWAEWPCFSPGRELEGSDNASEKGRTRYARYEETRIRISLGGLALSYSGIQPEHRGYFLDLLAQRRARQADEYRGFSKSVAERASEILDSYWASDGPARGLSLIQWLNEVDPLPPFVRLPIWADSLPSASYPQEP